MFKKILIFVLVSFGIAFANSQYSSYNDTSGYVYKPTSSYDNDGYSYNKVADQSSAQPVEYYVSPFEKNPEQQKPAQVAQPVVKKPLGYNYVFAGASLTGNWGLTASSSSNQDSKSYTNLGYGFNFGLRSETLAISLDFAKVDFTNKYNYSDLSLWTSSIQIRNYFTRGAYYLFGIGSTSGEIDNGDYSGFALVGGLGISMPVSNNIIIDISDVVTTSYLITSDNNSYNFRYINNAIKLTVSYAIPAKW